MGPGQLTALLRAEQNDNGQETTHPLPKDRGVPDCGASGLDRLRCRRSQLHF